MYLRERLHILLFSEIVNECNDGPPGPSGARGPFGRRGTLYHYIKT